MCNSDLDSEAIAVVSFADRSVKRMTVQELDALDERASGTDDPSRPLMVFRCCRELCANGIEETLTSAWNEE
jgi:hypothetical protein